MYPILSALFIFLPAGLANATPVFASRIPILKKLNYPLDCHRSFRGTRIFGDHKTVRGLLTGLLIGILTAIFEYYWFVNSPWLQSFIPLEYASLNPIILGTLLSLGALGGDALKSFFKRRAHVPSGKSWFPFDQLDYILGGCLLLSLYVDLSLSMYLIITIVWFTLHLASTIIGYLLHLKPQPI